MMALSANKHAGKTTIIGPLDTVYCPFWISYLYVTLSTSTHANGAHDSKDYGFCHSRVYNYVCMLPLFHA